MAFQRKFDRSMEIIKDDGPKVFFQKTINLIAKKYYKNIYKNYFDNKDEYDYLAEGAHKVVYRKADYVAALIPKEKFNEDKNLSLIEKMRLSREWYGNTFGVDFLNNEKLIEKENAIIWMQRYQEFQEDDLFYDITTNKEKIISFFEERRELREKLIYIFKKIIEVYEREGIIPDLFNAVSLKENNPANLYITKENKILFIDSHLVNFDRRKTDGKKYPFCRYVAKEYYSYLDLLILSIKEIVEKLE